MPAKQYPRSSEFADKKPVYEPKYARMLGSVTAAILLKQIAFWARLKKGQPFYKFNAPCKHKLFEEGDSWEEELGFSRSELDCARSKIGTKITQESGINKGDILMMDTAFFDEDGRLTNANRLVVYWTDADRVTWYIVNEVLLEDALQKADLKQDSCISRKSRNPTLAGNAESLHYPITEKTPETTTETTFHVEKSNVDFSRASQGNQIEHVEQQSLLPVEPGAGSSTSKKQGKSKSAREREPDLLFDAIAHVWGSAPSMTGKIKQQLTGNVPSKSPDYLANFDIAATPDEVIAFGEWYAKKGCPFPLSPAKIQTHFYTFRREQKASIRRNTPQTRVSNGRLLQYNPDSCNWYDMGPAPANHPQQQRHAP